MINNRVTILKLLGFPVALLVGLLCGGGLFVGFMVAFYLVWPFLFVKDSINRSFLLGISYVGVFMASIFMLFPPVPMPSPAIMLLIKGMVVNGLITLPCLLWPFWSDFYEKKIEQR